MLDPRPVFEARLVFKARLLFEEIRYVYIYCIDVMDCETSDVQHQRKYFCHACTSEIDLSLPVSVGTLILFTPIY